MRRLFFLVGFLSLFGVSQQAVSQELQFFEEDEQATAILVHGKRSTQSIDKLLGLTKMADLETNIHASTKKRPDDKYSHLETGAFEDRSFEPKAIFWEAPNICHNPLYFEDIGLERYGQDACYLQPALSGAHFFGRAATLPLQGMVKRPFSCDYPLGHYRPGNCNPYLHYSFPW